MLYLILDTATPFIICGLAKDKKILAQTTFKKNDTHLTILQIERLLQKTGYTLQDLYAISVGIGPGSYTGIRMASVIAEGLAYSKRLPVVTFSSLHLFSSRKKGPFYSVLSAYLSGVYCLQGVKEKDNLTFSNKPELLSFEKLKDLADGKSSFVTPDYTLLSERAPFISWEKRVPHLEGAVQTSYYKMLCQEFTSMPISPLYLRGP